MVMMFPGWWVMVAAVINVLLLFHGSSYAQRDPGYTFMHQATTAPTVSYYDYIIIGGGTAGCPLAATLSQNSSVLLLERGGSPYGNNNITHLAAFGAALSDLSSTSPSQRFVSEDGVVNARARVLGGGSCLNAGFYTRAGPDYVQLAGWDAKLVNESYEWVEKVVAFQPPLKQWQNAVRDGLVEAGIRPYNGFTYDHLYGTKIGGTIFDTNGHRHIAADLLQYVRPSRLTMLLNASVHQILFTRRERIEPKAHGVIFTDANGLAHRAYLKRGSHNEIIVSSGAIGSPQLLILSGIGPKEQLDAHNITVVVDQPMVGLGMSDNPMNAVFVPSPQPVIESNAFSPFRFDSLSIVTLLNMTASSPINLLPKHANASRSLEEFCKDTVMTIWHYHGGCQVARVVDRDYKVLGLDFPSVIDGSRFRNSPETNPQATVMMLGRYMGVKLMRDRHATGTNGPK